MSKSLFRLGDFHEADVAGEGACDDAGEDADDADEDESECDTSEGGEKSGECVGDGSVLASESDSSSDWDNVDKSDKDVGDEK